LLTGQTGEYGGTNNVRVYLNTGTNSAPTFGNYTAITCGGSPINLNRTCPVVYDLDRDGLKDLLTGEINGYVYFYKNSGTNSAPVFNSYQRLSTQTGYIVDGLAEPHIHFNDWDEDGDLDLVFGEYGPYNGYIRVYLNLTNPGVEEEFNRPIINNSLSVMPNPVTTNTLIKYTLNKESRVQVNIYSVDGSLVASPIDRYETSGEKHFNLNLRNLVPPGVYFIRLETEDGTQTTQVTVLK
jgi:hypothetical protein